MLAAPVYKYLRLDVRKQDILNCQTTHRSCQQTMGMGMCLEIRRYQRGKQRAWQLNLKLAGKSTICTAFSVLNKGTCNAPLALSFTIQAPMFSVQIYIQRRFY